MIDAEQLHQRMLRYDLINITVMGKVPEQSIRGLRRAAEPDAIG